MGASSEINGTSVAAITSVRSPSWYELLAPESDTAVTTIAGVDYDLSLIDEHGVRAVNTKEPGSGFYQSLAPDTFC